MNTESAIIAVLIVHVTGLLLVSSISHLTVERVDGKPLQRWERWASRVFWVCGYEIILLVNWVKNWKKDEDHG